jgi:hypothetical protein
MLKRLIAMAFCAGAMTIAGTLSQPAVAADLDYRCRGCPPPPPPRAAWVPRPVYVAPPTVVVVRRPVYFVPPGPYYRGWYDPRWRTGWYGPGWRDRWYEPGWRGYGPGWRSARWHGGWRRW